MEERRLGRAASGRLRPSSAGYAKPNTSWLVGDFGSREELDPTYKLLPIGQHAEPLGCLGRAEALGLLVPAARLLHVGDHAHYAELGEHAGIVGRAERHGRIGIA